METARRSHIKKKRGQGFRARSRTRDGRKILSNRRRGRTKVKHA